MYLVQILLRNLVKFEGCKPDTAAVVTKFAEQPAWKLSTRSSVAPYDYVCWVKHQ